MTVTVNTPTPEEMLEIIDRHLATSTEAIAALDQIKVDLQRVRHRLNVIEQSLDEAEARTTTLTRKKWSFGLLNRKEVTA